ncbi:MAG: TlpA family protein disulfide reductase [Fimbriimonas sp.]
MMSLLYCLIAPSAPLEDVLDRYVAFRKQAPAVEMAFRSRGARGTLVVNPGKQMRFEAKANGLDYLCVITPQGMTELDRIERAYDEQPYTSPGNPPSRMVNVSNLFPRWILAPDLRKIFPPTATFTSLGQRTIGGVSGEVVRGVNKDEEGGEHQLEAVIDAQGAPRYLLVSGQSRMGSYRMDWTIDRIKPIAPPPSSTYAFKIPDGYSPFSLDLIPGPMGVGNKVPLTGWRAAAGGELNLGQRLPKGGLIAILDRESQPSRRAAGALARIRTGGVTVVTLSSDTSAAPGTDGYDPTGKLLDGMGVPSTPAFFRVDGTGKITAVWLGYDPAKSEEFVREVTK